VENPRACYEPAHANARLLDRGSSKTKPRSGGNQPAHESLLNRRLQPCPLPWTSSRSTAPGLNQNADACSKPLTANMRAGSSSARSCPRLQPVHQLPLRADRIKACSNIARSRFSGGIEGRPIGEYKTEKSPAKPARASFTMARIARSGWFWPTRSSRSTSLNSDPDRASPPALARPPILAGN
jgi:hypothetical protein